MNIGMLSSQCHTLPVERKHRPMLLSNGRPYPCCLDLPTSLQCLQSRWHWHPKMSFRWIPLKIQHLPQGDSAHRADQDPSKTLSKTCRLPPVHVASAPNRLPGAVWLAPRKKSAGNSCPCVGHIDRTVDHPLGVVEGGSDGRSRT